MNVTYIQHSGFSVDFADMMLVFDYWMGEITIPEDKPVYVFVSHAHHDHFNEEIFEWKEAVWIFVTFCRMISTQIRQRTGSC